MAVDCAAVDELKHLLMTSERLSVILDFFFDHFGENLAFLQVGFCLPPTDKRLEMLKSVVGQAAETVRKRRGIIENLHMVEVGERGFFHGGCRIGTDLVTFVFFEDMESGAMVFAPMPGSGRREPTQFSRFTATPLNKKLTPMTNLHPAPKKRTVH